MNTDMNRKNFSFTKKAIRNASQQERLSYGPLIAELRSQKSMTQEELAERSGVTARTIRNIESGHVAGQAEKLISLLIALDVDLTGSEWPEDVQQYVAMIAPLLTSIDQMHRLPVVTEVVTLLTDVIQKHPNVTRAPEDENTEAALAEIPVISPAVEATLRALPRAAKRGKNLADLTDAE